ncbi:D-arabinono-1,4-lactone oxidase [Agrococcus sp. BE272]|uniref:D-arabinono-1,4-lactone oxidase n=1 Tax=Agrococcus sp. BE272 TaxID=2817727 RepID=UPI0028677EE7|nr:D-arabinono-1,4-lactone oxidase [Agrococcus sp. BE272]MDR7234994.1 FAD-linked oxidoreductase [Agrococcus sp. BE272]
MTWTNWARSQRAEPREVDAPRTIESVRRAVERVAARGGTMRPVGSGHSFSGAARPDDAQLRLDGLTGLLDVDRERRRATVLAGTRIRDLSLLLAQHGLALDNLGDVDVQTIAGAISTGTHGTGLAHRSIGASVVAATLVAGDGSLVRVSDEERPDLLPAVRLGLGALGVLVDVTLQCVPAFALDAVETTVALDAVLDDWMGLLERTDHFECYWFAATRVAATKSNTRVDGPLRPRSAVGRFVDERLLTDVGHRALLALGALVPATAAPLNELSARLLPRGRFVEPSHEVFAAPRAVRFRELEYGLPVEAVPEALREIDRALRRADLVLTFPFELRAAAADDAHLSTALGRDTGYIAAHRWWREDPRPLFEIVEPILLAHDGRPHWGKLHSLRAPELAQRFPGFAAFAQARDELDPARVFASSWTRRVLGA